MAGKTLREAGHVLNIRLSVLAAAIATSFIPRDAVLLAVDLEAVKMRGAGIGLKPEEIEDCIREAQRTVESSVHLDAFAICDIAADLMVRKAYGEL